MSLRWRRFALVVSTPLATLISSCGSDPSEVSQPPLTLRSIVIDQASQNVERGTRITLTATAHDTAGNVVSVPYVWRSSVDSIATFALNGVLTVHDTGVTIVTASALGVTSAAIGIHVVWLGAAKIDTFHWNPPNAVIPGVTPADSIRVIVTNLGKGPAVGAKVVFAVTAGGGTLSPTSGVVNQSGTVATQWTLGPAVGQNTVTATVVDTDGVLIPWVTGNPATFKVKAYTPLAVIQGDGQTGNILSALPVNPSVRLTDSSGVPRPGVPITFTPTGNGRVARTVVPTSVDGVASPGVWTLGDVSGDQQLVVTIESAKITLHATAVGGSVHYAANQLATSQVATCALTNDQFVSCFGRSPQIGTGDTASQSSPTLTKGKIAFTSVVGAPGGAHFCGTGTDFSIYCWGISALVDTSGVATSDNAPTRLPSNVAWLQVTPGGQHNCALDIEHTAWCWGADTSGQLGDNSSTQRFVPKPVDGGFKFSSLAAGASHECGLIADGTAFCWGLNASGQLGDGTTANRGGPTAVKGGLKFQSIGAGSGWTCALSGGSAYCWGAGTVNNSPIAYPATPLFSTLNVGSAHACALTSDGTAYCWGDNSGGQLGDSTTTSRTAPTLVVTDLKFKSISAGFQHTCAITIDGFVACWGLNQFGELGVSVPSVSVQTTPRYIVLGVTP